MLALSETFGRSDQPPRMDPIPGFKMYNCERGGGDKGGGGLCMLYRDSLSAHQWTPPVPERLQYVKNERQWMLVDGKVAFLHIYIACQTTRSDSYLQWNEDLFDLVTQEAMVMRRQGLCCIAMGDFNTRVGELPGLSGNTPDTNNNYPMFMNFITQVNMTIINTLPIARGLFTRFMNNSGDPGTKSLLDYGLVDNDHVHNVTSFVIDEDARYSAGSDHALLQCVVEVEDHPKVSWSYSEAVHYNITEKTDYSEYLDSLENAIETIPLHEFSKLPVTDMLPHISEKINASAKSALGLKVKKVQRGRRLPVSVRKMIQAKNTLAKSISSQRDTLTTSNAEKLELELDHLKAGIKDALSGLKLQQRSCLRSRLLLADPTRKRFWRFLKSQIKSAGTMTAAYDKSGKMVFEQDEIEEAVLDHFTQIFKAQRIPVFATPPPPDQTQLVITELEEMLSKSTVSFESTKFEEEVCPLYSFTELGQELDGLANGKASGYDNVANELLKNSGYKFRLYLLSFLNKVMEEGVVPQDLNIGKCMLIHKVRLLISFLLDYNFLTLGW